jgi:hypothetical protein
VAHAVPRARTPVPSLGRPVRAGADSVDGASFSWVEHALVMAHAEWGVRPTLPARIGGGRQGVPAQPSTSPRDDGATHLLAATHREHATM